MPIPQLEQSLIASRRGRVNARGLNQWPQDEPEDQAQLQRYQQWLDGLADPVCLAHPIYPLMLPVNSAFSARMAYYFAIGDYEQADLQLIDEMILPGDRVMECGAGAGVTGSFAGMRSTEPVVLVEPNAAMYPQIRATFAANEQVVRLVEAAVVPDDFSSDQIELGIFDEYWWSSALAPASADRRVNVRARQLSSLLQEHQPTVLVLDIEGGECGLFPAMLPDTLRMIMIEIHTPDIGEQATLAVVNNIQGQGFKLTRLLAQTWLFTR